MDTKISSNQYLMDQQIVSQERRITPFIRIPAEPDAIGWSTIVFTFPSRGFTISTVLEEPSSGETQSCMVWFEQDSPSDPTDISTIVYLQEDLEIPGQIATGALTCPLALPGNTNGLLLRRATFFGTDLQEDQTRFVVVRCI